MLALTGISKSFGDKQILKNASLSLDNHEVVGLIGNNGSGKTTILKIITGEISPDTGNIQKENEVICYLPQFPDFGDLTVEGFLQSKLGDSKDEYKINLVLSKLDLSKISKTQLASSLSGGQKTRLYLASLLLSDPTVLLLDEPTNNLDALSQRIILEVLKEYNGAMLIVSHTESLLKSYSPIKL